MVCTTLVHEPVITVHRLDREVLEALLHGRTLVVRVPEFFQSSELDAIATRFVRHPGFGHYDNVPEVGRFGHAFYESIGRPELRRRYFQDAAHHLAQIRGLFEPAACPIDTLRLQLDEIWPRGANLKRWSGEPMFAGLVRVFEAGAEAFPHQDILLRDTPEHPTAGSLDGQIAANIYLKLPPRGGQLEVWERILSDEEYERLRMPDSYGVARCHLGHPAASITPRPGELVLFDSWRVHAVRRAEGGARLTQSCFIGHRAGNPLLLWS